MISIQHPRQEKINQSSLTNLILLCHSYATHSEAMMSIQHPRQEKINQSSLTNFILLCRSYATRSEAMMSIQHPRQEKISQSSLTNLILLRRSYATCSEAMMSIQHPCQEKINQSLTNLILLHRSYMASYQGTKAVVCRLCNQALLSVSNHDQPIHSRTHCNLILLEHPKCGQNGLPHHKSSLTLGARSHRVVSAHSLVHLELGSLALMAVQQPPQDK